MPTLRLVMLVAAILVSTHTAYAKNDDGGCNHATGQGSNCGGSSRNYPPVIHNSPSSSASEDRYYSYTPSVTDKNRGDTKRFSITNKPSWASFSTTTGRLSGTPRNSNVGTTSNVRIAVSDRRGLTAYTSYFSLRVANTNDVPLISGTPITSVKEDSHYSFTPRASDVDVGDTRTFSIVNKPVWASFNASTGQVSGIPRNANVGVTSNVRVSVRDRAGAIAHLRNFSLTVINTNDAPVITGVPITSTDEDSFYAFTPMVSDVDLGDSKTFLISNKPVWASFSSISGKLSGTPNNSNVGTTNNIMISVRDRAGSTDILSAFSLTVNNVNDAPEPVIEDTNAVDIDTQEIVSYSIIDVDNATVSTSWQFVGANRPGFITFETHNKSGDVLVSRDSVAGSYLYLMAVSDDDVTVERLVSINVEDNRPVNVNMSALNSLPTQVMLRSGLNSPKNAIYASNMRDKLGLLLSGVHSVKVSSSADSVPALVAGHQINPGQAVTFNHSITEAGFIELLVIAQGDGHAKLTMEIETD